MGCHGWLLPQEPWFFTLPVWQEICYKSSRKWEHTASCPGTRQGVVVFAR